MNNFESYINAVASDDNAQNAYHTYSTKEQQELVNFYAESFPVEYADLIADKISSMANSAIQALFLTSANSVTNQVQREIVAKQIFQSLKNEIEDIEDEEIRRVQRSCNYMHKSRYFQEAA